MKLTRRNLLGKTASLSAFTALAAACGGGAVNTSPSPSRVVAPSASPTFSGTYAIRVGLSGGPTASATIGAQRWADLVSQRSQGHVALQLYPNAQLGNSTQLTSQTVSGGVDATIVDTSEFVSYDPRFTVIALPYLFAEDKAQALFSSKIGQEMLGYLEPKGLKGLAWGTLGLRGVINRTKNASSPADFVGMRIRTDGSPLFTSFWQQVKAQPVSGIGGSEIYLSLSRGVIDAADTAAGFSVAQKFYEVANFYTNTAHSVGLGMVIFNLNRYNQLPPEVQAVLKSSAEEAGALITQTTIQQDKDAFVAMRAKGMTVVDTVDIELWRAAVKPVFDKFAASLPADLVGAIQQAVR